MNDPTSQAVAVQAIRNASPQQLEELLGVLATCYSGPITIPHTATEAILSTRQNRRLRNAAADVGKPGKS